MIKFSTVAPYSAMVRHDASRFSKCTALFGNRPGWASLDFEIDATNIHGRATNWVYSRRRRLGSGSRTTYKNVSSGSTSQTSRAVQPTRRLAGHEQALDRRLPLPVNLYASERSMGGG